MTSSALQPLPTPTHDSIDSDPRQVIRSPEQVALHLPVAGPASRILAYAIDGVAIAFLEIGLLVLIFLSTPLVQRLQGPLERWAQDMTKGNPNDLVKGQPFFLLFAALLILQFVVEWGYFLFWEMASGGRSLGKFCLKLRVVRDGGLPITWHASLVRNLLRMVDLLPGSYGVGLVAMVLSDEGKRLGDLAAGTVVVRLDRPPPAPPLLERGVVAGAEAFRFEPSQIAQIGANERALLRLALRRVESLAPQRAEAVLSEAVEALRQRMGYGAVEPEQRRAFLEALLHAVSRR